MDLLLEYLEHNLIALKWNDEVELMLDSHFFENDGYDPENGCHVQYHGKHFFIGN